MKKYTYIARHYKRNKAGYILSAAVCAVCGALVLSLLFFFAQCDGVRKQVVRLHVLANSDSDFDQAVKLAVRDRLLSEGGDIFTTAYSTDEALRLANENSERLREAAEDELKLHGSTDSVSISIGKSDFGTRSYESFTLPAGSYDAVKVIIGSGEGQNWWCVMFPPLCLPSAQAEDRLKETLAGADEPCENPSGYRIRFKAVEIYEKIAAMLS